MIRGQNNSYIYPFVFDYFKQNDGVTLENKNNVIAALTYFNLIDFSGLQYWLNTVNFKINALQTLLNNPTNQEFTKIINTIAFNNSLPIDSKIWIGYNQNVFNDIIDYLIINDFSQESKDLAIDLIDYLINNIDVSWNEIYESFFSPYPEIENLFTVINPDDITYDTQLTIQSLPTLASFISSFPKNGSNGNYTQMPASDVYNLVGGSLLESYNINPNAYANACSIRGSRGLLYSNIQIPILNYNGSQRTQKGADLKNYILDAISFNKFMKDKFGETANKLEGTATNDPQQVLNFYLVKMEFM
jgi:hypothetical protein